MNNIGSIVIIEISCGCMRTHRRQYKRVYSFQWPLRNVEISSYISLSFCDCGLWKEPFLLPFPFFGTGDWVVLFYIDDHEQWWLLLLAFQWSSYTFTVTRCPFDLPPRAYRHARIYSHIYVLAYMHIYIIYNITINYILVEAWTQTY